MVTAGYVQDDSVNIPDYIKNMSKNDLKVYIEKLEKQLFGAKETPKK